MPSTARRRASAGGVFAGQQTRSMRYAPMAVARGRVLPNSLTVAVAAEPTQADCWREVETVEAAIAAWPVDDP
jgi:hypothetical protein